MRRYPSTRLLNFKVKPDLMKRIVNMVFPIYPHHPHPEEEVDGDDGDDDDDAAEHSASVPCSPSLKYVDETRRSDQSVERPARSFSPGRTCSSTPPPA